MKVRTKYFIILLICFFGFLFSSGQNAKKYPNKYLPGQFGKLKYDKIIAYDFDGRNEIIVRHGKVLDSLVNKKVTLSKKQIDTLESILFNTDSYDEHRRMNFLGYKMGIVYYLNGKIIAHISISLEENATESNFPIPAQFYRKIQVPHEKYYVNMNGFSKTSREKIKKLCKELGFRYGDFNLDSKPK